MILKHYMNNDFENRLSQNEKNMLDQLKFDLGLLTARRLENNMVLMHLLILVI